MNSKGIGLDDVRSAIQQGNVNLPTGSLNGDHKSYLIQANGQLSTADAYRSANCHSGFLYLSGVFAPISHQEKNTSRSSKILTAFSKKLGGEALKNASPPSLLITQPEI